MTNSLPDIDIDLADRNKLLELIQHIPAGIIKDNKVRKHNTGVYVQDIPFDPLKKCATIDYKDAEDRGYFKIDFLNNSTYEGVKNEEHLLKLMDDPPWELLWMNADFCSKIAHVGNYYSLLKKMKPDSVEKMAMFLAILRPGKKHLQNKSWDEIKKTVWDKPTNGNYYFKHSHSISYSVMISVNINLLIEQIESDSIEF